MFWVWQLEAFLSTVTFSIKIKKDVDDAGESRYYRQLLKSG